MAREGEWIWHIVEARLREAARQIEAGADLAPARRHRIEGMLELLLADGGFSREEIAARCAAILPAEGVVRIAEDRVVLDLWQRRAPVHPSTRD
jgi:hypothetical protein